MGQPLHDANRAGNHLMRYFHCRGLYVHAQVPILSLRRSPQQHHPFTYNATFKEVCQFSEL